MTGELAVQGAGAVVMLDRERLDLLKRTVAEGLNDTEFELFAQVANRSGLDPFMRQIHAVKRWSKAAGRDVMTIQVGIDGYRLIADRTGKYAGSDDGEFEGTTSDGFPSLARVTVWKLVGTLRVAFTASARWDEYYPGEKLGMMWRKMPHVMLAKVAEALALRKAFPAELSGLYTAEEMDQADREYRDVPSRDAVEAPEPVTTIGKLNKRVDKSLSLAQKLEFKEWKDKQEFAWPWSDDDCDAMNTKIDQILAGTAPGEPSPAVPAPGDAPDDESAVGPSPADSSPVDDAEVLCFEAGCTGIADETGFCPTHIPETF